MSKDAKLGLVIGIAAVIVIAVVFFRKDPAFAKASAEASAAAVKPKSALQAPNAPVVSDVFRTPSNLPRTHTVAPGDTLFGLAEHYYQDRSQFVAIYRANQQKLPAPDHLAPGTVLTLPDLADR